MAARRKATRVCRECHRVVEGESCVVCSTANLSEDWAGYLVIIDPEHSEIAKKMNITMAGKYALKVR
ncbi:MAG: DNA-directed RNA polymerase, subunit E'' [Methanomicrobiaceae archaeon]|uniref:Dna-directed rna polymerase subunit e n=1 Tax=hydrocarbon metagenome TaxID=938273 RepID=A0A0W8FK70_9ZZZZ|nr:DNA-directed RNA polymerase, subunit E'' [Methanomicrobiaceae archaeon]MDD5420206.1 DNA-directed RNA polymerase, subunit E'' [Methanomicrobiaceae archaeon]